MFQRKTVSVQLMGGLGNQLFQLAAGLYVSSNLGYKLELDTSFYNIHNSHDGFCVDKLVDLSDISKRQRRDLFRKRIRESGYQYQLRQLLAEEIDTPSFRGLSLRGYWQTAYTAAASKQQMLARLLMKRTEVNRVGSQVCFLHVRRGDYFTPANQKLYDVIPENYYREAVLFMLERRPNTIFRVFSDDFEYARKFIQSLPPATYKLEKTGGSLEDFDEMRRCNRAICANSSFSWWAAFLMEQPAVVVMPKRWDNISPGTAHHRWPENASEVSNIAVAFGEGN
jgi:hypothetical protein